MTKYKLSDQTLALMANQLQVPMVMSDLLRAPRIPLREDVTYALHEVLSQMDPLSTLMAVALGARTLINTQTRATPTRTVLNMEATRLIATYQTLWQENAEDPLHDPEHMLAEMNNIAEDLEGMVEILQLLADDLPRTQANAVALTGILAAQAKAASLTAAQIAEQFETMNEDTNGSLDLFVPEMMASVSQASNVIPFPRRGA